jgi:hypothetical protein
LEHLRETRFPVPKIAYSGTLGWRSALQNKAISVAPRSKRPRICASWGKFQNSPRRQQSPAGCPKSVPRLLTRPSRGRTVSLRRAEPFRASERRIEFSNSGRDRADRRCCRGRLSMYMCIYHGAGRFASSEMATRGAEGGVPDWIGSPLSALRPMGSGRVFLWQGARYVPIRCLPRHFGNQRRWLKTVRHWSRSEYFVRRQASSV